MAYKLRYVVRRERNDGTEDEPKIAIYDQPMVMECPSNVIDTVLTQAKSKAYNGEVTVEEIPEPPMTEEEARAKRDKMLAETDWTQTLDAPLSDEMKEAFRVYRQALRDIPQQENFPAEIIWPTKPETV